MLFTIAQYRSLADDEQSRPVATGGRKGLISVIERTSLGDMTLDAAAKFIKISVSEAVTVNPHGAREPLQGYDWWQVNGGETVTFAAVP